MIFESFHKISPDKFAVHQSFDGQPTLLGLITVSTLLPRCGLTVRRILPGEQDEIRGLFFNGQEWTQLSAGEVMDAYAHDVNTGELIAPGTERFVGPEE